MKNLFVRYGRKSQEIIIEALQFSLVSIVMIVLVLNVPLFQLALFIVPALFTALTYRNGSLAGIAALCGSCGAVYSIYSDANLIVVMMIGTMGVLVGELYYRKRDMMTAIMAGILVVVAGFGLIIYLQMQMTGGNFLEYFINEYMRTAQEAGLESMMNVDLTEVKFALRYSFPALVIYMGIVFSVINYFFAGRIVTRMNPSEGDFRGFEEFSLPGNALTVLAVTVAGSWLATVLTEYSQDIILNNVLVIYSLLLFIQGLSVVDFLFLKDRHAILRNLVRLILIFSVFPYPLMITVGTMDLIFNIRRLPR